jgi:hypothetical protein
VRPERAGRVAARKSRFYSGLSLRRRQGGLVSQRTAPRREACRHPTCRRSLADGHADLPIECPRRRRIRPRPGFGLGHVRRGQWPACAARRAEFGGDGRGPERRRRRIDGARSNHYPPELDVRGGVGISEATESGSSPGHDPPGHTGRRLFSGRRRATYGQFTPPG